jgi:hypothetical protein
MKTIVKYALVGAVLAAGAANADPIVTNLANAPGGSDLVLFVTDTSTNTFYVQDLGIRVDDLRTRTQVAGDPGTFNIDGTGTTGPLNVPSAFNLTSPNLAAFFSSHVGDSFTWSILGSDVTGGTQTPGSQRVVSTSTLDMITGNAFWDSTGVVASAQNMHSFFQNDLNQAAFTNGVSSSSGYGDSTLGKNAPGTWNSIGNGAAVGTAQTLFMFATEGGGNDANVYAGAYQLSLSLTGQLSGAPTSNVPLPAAVWLLGSGLMGLAGVGRRRRTASVVAA